ncbi:MAG: hypothetical protein JNG90_18640, partial [Planctomycetaceae bacterium]|nr:hypothetical protein [Planctomycetaceae bacterium]
MKIFARCDDLAAVFAASGAAEPGLLLEGDWPAASTSSRLWSLDEAIDARAQWIDATAAWLAAELECGPSRVRSAAAATHALALRYYLVRLLRPIAFFQDAAARGGPGNLEFFGTPERDDDYAALLAMLAEREGQRLVVHWRPFSAVREPAPAEASTWRARLRPLAARTAGWLDRRPSPHASAARFVLCGNPRILDPLCSELVSRGADVAWLYEQFAFRSWLRWRPQGVGQWVCGAAPAPVSDIPPEHALPFGAAPPLLVRGVDLAGLVDRWLEQRCQHAGERWQGFQERLAARLRAARPRAIVLDQDATPLARTAIAAARELAIPTWVVQHGVTGVRFGFAPLAADRICVADEASRRQLRAWEIPDRRMHVTGSPARDELRRRLAAVCAPAPHPTGLPEPTLLLLLSNSPRDERPDSVTFHLTTRTATELLATVQSALRAWPGAHLLVKLHPREQRAAELRALLCSSSAQPVSIVAGPLERLLPRADVVLSCASTAGIDAAALGWPVIQLLPRGSGELLPADEYGLLG